MADEKKVEKKEEVPINQFHDTTKGPTLFGKVSHIEPKLYNCPKCGTISGADILWKLDKGKNIPLCGICESPVDVLKTDE